MPFHWFIPLRNPFLLVTHMLDGSGNGAKTQGVRPRNSHAVSICLFLPSSYNPCSGGTSAVHSICYAPTCFTAVGLEHPLLLLAHFFGCLLLTDLLVFFSACFFIAGSRRQPLSSSIGFSCASYSWTLLPPLPSALFLWLAFLQPLKAVQPFFFLFSDHFVPQSFQVLCAIFFLYAARVATHCSFRFCFSWF